MRRYWIEANQLQGEQVRFSEEVFHHIFDVCRQTKGSKFEVLVGDQKARLVEVTEVRKKEATAQVIETREVPALPRPHLHLVLSIPRFPIFEAVLEKAVEMGVHTLHLAYSENSFIRQASSLPPAKWERWQKIIVSATQQCGRGELMSLPKPRLLSEIREDFNRSKGRLGLFAYEGSAAMTVRQALHGKRHDILGETWIFVGSEGGYSEQEVQEFQQVGLESLTLGEQVLRVETACIALLAILKYELASD